MYSSLTPACADLFEPRRLGIRLLKSMFNAEKFHAQVVLVYLQLFRRNSLLICVSQPEIAKKSTKIPYFGDSFRVIQDHRC